jgi:hypothetical protein
VYKLPAEVYVLLTRVAAVLPGAAMGDRRLFAKMAAILPYGRSLFLEFQAVVRYSDDKSSTDLLHHLETIYGHRKKRYVRGEFRVHLVIIPYFRFLDEFSRMILTTTTLKSVLGNRKHCSVFCQVYSYLIVNTLSMVLADKLMKENGRTPFTLRKRRNGD